MQGANCTDDSHTEQKRVGLAFTNQHLNVLSEYTTLQGIPASVVAIRYVRCFEALLWPSHGHCTSSHMVTGAAGQHCGQVGEYQEAYLHLQPNVYVDRIDASHKVAVRCTSRPGSHAHEQHT